MEECGGVHIHFPVEGSGSDTVVIRGPSSDVEKAKKQLLHLAEEKVSMGAVTVPLGRKRRKRRSHVLVVIVINLKMRLVRTGSSAIWTRLLFVDVSEKQQSLRVVFGESCT
ncbi:hypothetical protein P7K49_013225 [Saguinus oedipus]|uniref:K Homology domain-containing protein n=1 Tax=Saguinus oedipus TaxID=9490 RepID=A0ABQ9VG47_SAGOE|nr:hypothetical protein P7K49_013225 [Saguinus oedipus]